jgi:glycerol kinase
MPDAARLLAIDQGTTSSRAMAFDAQGRALASRQREIAQHFPADGWVEHDPEEIWATTLETCRGALEAVGGARAIAALGITNQRETTLLWRRDDGRAVHRAIVWQDRRTAEACRRLIADGAEPDIQTRTGLVVDPYFSATKLAWLLDSIDGARDAARRGQLAFGTVDSFLLWRLTGGRVHATDATNASRTQLFNIRTQDWDDDLLKLFDIPRAVLPEVRDSAGDFGTTEKTLLGGALPIRGIAGDQQAALVGQACFTPGMIKSTYGTGCFVLLNIGDAPLASRNRLVTTVAYRLGGHATYALEGSIFVAGAAVQWLRDGLSLIGTAAETEALAQSVADTGGVYLVPAFTGLGAPHWDPDARGAIFGLTRDTGRAQLVRATLESVGYQTRDLLEAMTADGARPTALRVDGGMTVNNWLMQLLADLLGVPVERPRVVETTALGAAYLAGLGAGVYGSLDDIAANWARDRRFEPALGATSRDRLYAGWRDAVRRTRSGAGS